MLRSFFLLMACLIGGETQAWAGANAATFLESDIGARSIGMAGAYTAVSDDNLALHHNPAGLAHIGRKEASLTYISGVEGSSHQHAAYSHPFAKTWTAAVGVNYVTSGPIDRYDAAGNLDGSYVGTGMAAQLALAKDLFPGFKAGVSAKLIRETLDSRRAYGKAADVGVMYDYGMLRLGAALTNAGPDMRLYREKFPLPRTFKVGASVRPLAGFTVSVDAHKVRDAKTQAAFAGEYKLSGSETCNYMAFRLGYKLQTLEEGIGPDITGGFGAQFLNNYVIDLAFLPYGDMGNLTVVSLTYRFGADRNAPEKTRPEPLKQRVSAR